MFLFFFFYQITDQARREIEQLIQQFYDKRREDSQPSRKNNKIHPFGSSKVLQQKFGNVSI